MLSKISEDSQRYASQLFTICEASYTFGSPWTAEQFAADLQLATSHYYIVKKAEQVVGFISFSKLFDEVEIYNVAVLPEFRGQKIAQQLLAAVVAELTAPGKIFLEVRESNMAARKLYQKVGFVELNRRKSYYKEPVEDCLVMMKEVETCQKEN